MPNTMTDIYTAFFSELEKVATPSFRERQMGAYRASRDQELSAHLKQLAAETLPALLAAYQTRGMSTGAQLAAVLPTMAAGHAIGRVVSGQKEHLKRKGIKAGILDYEFSPQAQARYIDPYVKEGEIMPPPSGHIKRTAGSPVPRGPRMKAGGRVGTTTAHPFSGNKAKVAGIGPAVAGAALGAGTVGAYRTFKEPALDFLDAKNPERRLAVPITPHRTKYIALQNPLGPLFSRRNG